MKELLKQVQEIFPYSEFQNRYTEGEVIEVMEEPSCKRYRITFYKQKYWLWLFGLNNLNYCILKSKNFEKILDVLKAIKECE